MSVFYGSLIGTVKEFYIVTVQNGSHVHIKVNAGNVFNNRIDIGSSIDNVYYTVFTHNDYAVQTYLLPMIERHLNLDWLSNFNILAQDSVSGALDFYRTPALYAHISGKPGMTKNISNTPPSNTRIIDTTIGLTNAQLTNKYGALATAIRTMFTIYANRKIIVFGRQAPSKVESIIHNISFSQEISDCGKYLYPYTDGAIFFYDSKNRLLDGIFTMSSKQYHEFIKK